MFTSFVILQAALLGLVQGLTEFLPVSSSAHLILARAFFGWDGEQFGVAFDVACHVGTLVAVVAYFSADVRAMMAALPGLFARPPNEPARRVWLIVVGTLPAVAIGVLFNDLIEDRLRTPAVCGVTLALGAVAMLVAERLGPRTRDDGSITAGEALALGCAQAAALVPGVSRSGATLTLAMFLGLRREAAARFSFLLGIPAILAAALNEGITLRGQPVGSGMLTLFGIGIAASAFVGYLAVKYFIQYLGRHSLAVFAWYRLALAAIVFAWLVAR